MTRLMQIFNVALFDLIYTSCHNLNWRERFGGHPAIQETRDQARDHRARAAQMSCTSCS